MNRLDSLDVRLAADEHEQTARLDSGPGVSVSRGHRADGNPFDVVTVAPGPSLPGINRLRFDRQDGSLALSVSAKALLGDYARGIGPETLAQLAEAVNRSGVVSVTPEGLLSASVTAADVFVDLDTRQAGEGGDKRSEDRVRDGFDSLRALSTNSRYRMDAEGPVSLRFRTNTRRGRDELGIYGKGPELAKADNREFLRQAGPLPYRQLAGAVRFERRARGPSLVKRLCSRGIRDPFATLADVFGSEARPVSDLFGQIKGDAGQRDLFDDLERLIDASPKELGKPAALTWLRDQIGNRGIAEAAGWDPEAARRIVKRVAGSKNAWRYYAPVIDWIEARAAGPDADARGLTNARLEAFAAAVRAAEDRPAGAFARNSLEWLPRHVPL